MALKEGIVSRISIKEIPEDQYENKFKIGFQLEGSDTWYDAGSVKFNKFDVKQGKEYVNIEVGDTIEFKYTTREWNEKTYYNAKRSDISISKKGSGSAPKPASPRGATPVAAPSHSGSPKPASTGTDWARKDAGAAASASVDKAIAYLAATSGFDGGHRDADMGLIYDVARRMQEIVLKLSDEILAGPAAKPAPAPKPAAAAVKPAPKKAAPTPEPSWENEEEELPFS